MNQIFAKPRMLYMVIILLTIVVGEYILHPNHWDTWPAFMCMVFFFCVHRDFKQAPHILIGGAFGILQIYLIKLWYAVAVPMFGGDMSKYTDPHTQHALFTSKLIYILIFVALIVLLKDVLSYIFNDFTFMFFIVAGVAAGAHTSIAVAAKTVAGTAMAVVGTTGNEALIAGMQGALDKALVSLIPVTNVFEWMAICVIGGGLIILALHYGGVLLAKVLSGGAAQPPAHH